MAGVLTRRNLLSFDFGDRTSESDHWVRIHRVAMACRFEVMLASSDSGHLAAARAALDEAGDLDSALTFFHDAGYVPDSNRRGAAEEVTVPGRIFSLLTRSAELHARTGGAFDVTLGPLSRCWSFLQRDGRLPTDENVAGARRLVGMRHMRLDAARHRVHFDRAGVEVNFDAIGKGYALDRMGESLRERGARRALLTAGHSSVLALGGKGRGWPVDLRPRLASRRVGRLWIKNGAVGTSGAGEKFVEIDGHRYGHVIDPRSGRPAHGVLGASVITGDAATADALSAAFLVGGPQLAQQYCAAYPDVLAVLALDHPGEPTEVFGRYNGATLEMLA